MRPSREIAVIDAETDPFKYGRTPAPFVWGLWWRGNFWSFWGDDCTDQLIKFLENLNVTLLIYAHNGGKFDFYFLLEHLGNPIKLIHGRIAKAAIGKHELRDSWLIYPMALSAYKKDAINYDLFERGVREKHRAEIISYLRGDCKYLHELCEAFIKRFGKKLTAPSAAMAELRKIHPQKLGGKSHDEKFRPFYFGGRVQCFVSGVHEGAWKVYDVNSMYPYVMRNFDHPAGTEYVVIDSPDIDSAGWIVGYPACHYFVEIEGLNHGALPLREKDGLSFNVRSGLFITTSHEFRLSLSLGVFRGNITRALIPHGVQRFVEFVDKFGGEKIAAKKSGDKIGEIHAKLVQNSAYGKFGQNPEDFDDYLFQKRHVDPMPDFDIWESHEEGEFHRFWRRRKTIALDDGSASVPRTVRGYFDVAIAASITSAARSVLMQAISNATRPAYCDTDSIICESLSKVEFDDYKLGAWKKEAEGNKLAVAGKKLYALFDESKPRPIDPKSKECQCFVCRCCVKSASKGVILPPHEILSIAKGSSIEWRNEAPSFKKDGHAEFIKRTVRQTAKIPV